MKKQETTTKISHWSKKLTYNLMGHPGDLKAWLSKLLLTSIENISTESDRMAVIQWLAQISEMLREECSTKDKIIEIYKIVETKQVIRIFLNGLNESMNNFKHSDLPIPIKIALPLTGIASLLIGGQGLGLVAFGGAIGLPVLLLIFLGSAGLASVVETFIRNKDSRSYISVVMGMVAYDEINRRVSKTMKEAMTAEPIIPKVFEMPTDKGGIREKLLAMDPFDFERYVMSFFERAGLISWVTKKSNDFGIDGFAKHPNGLIVVQCKRNNRENSVGRPVIQQFKGVIEEQSAWRGYVVTTSHFTTEAEHSSKLSEKIELVDLEQLIQWHKILPRF